MKKFLFFIKTVFFLQIQATDNDACSPNNLIDYSIEGENVINFDITYNGTLQVSKSFSNANIRCSFIICFLIFNVCKAFN